MYIAVLGLAAAIVSEHTFNVDFTSTYKHTSSQVKVVKQSSKGLKCKCYFVCGFFELPLVTIMIYLILTVPQHIYKQTT